MIKKLPHDINRGAAKISALSSEESEKYEYITGEEISPSDQRTVIEHAKLTYSPLRKSLKKHTKIDWRASIKTNKGTWKQSRKKLF